VHCGGTKNAWRRFHDTHLEYAAMDLDMHQAIARKLEAGKLAGWLSDYLVAWHGPSDGLMPEVTVWRSPNWTTDTVKSYLKGLLGGLVPERGIVIAE
jgi:hypothetical protein